MTRVAFLELIFALLVSSVVFASGSPSAKQNSESNAKAHAEMLEPAGDITTLNQNQNFEESAQNKDMLEREALKAFLRNDCAKILSLRTPEQYEKSSPRLLALIASCEPDGKDPDKMLDYARSKAPKDDTLLLLHARYRSKKQMINANDLWKQLQDRTTDPRLKEIATDYLSGMQTDVDEMFSNKTNLVIGFVQAGPIFDTNPSFSPLGSPTTSSSGVGATGILNYRHSEPFGRFGLDYSVSNSSYFQNHSGDMNNQELGTPIEFDSTNTSALSLKPYISYVSLGGTSYLYDLGFSMGVSYDAETLPQSITGSVYYESHFSTADQPQDGTHLRLEYSIKPALLKTVTTNLTAFVDHASAGIDSTDPTASIPYSNTTSGLIISAETQGTKWAIGATESFIYRDDDSFSSYLGVNNNQVKKNRADRTIQSQVYVSRSVSASSQLILSLQHLSMLSNLDALDYLNRNAENSSALFAFRWNFNN